jgi:hypothetical protein
MLDLGFDCIGRQSCHGGAADILAMLAGKKREIAIMADTDTPGQRGAAQLAIDLRCGAKIITPLKGKDAREWKRSGATRDVVAAIIANSRPADISRLRTLIKTKWRAVAEPMHTTAMDTSTRQTAPSSATPQTTPLTL